MAWAAGGFREATCNALKPPHDTPIMPTAPVHQVCAANHAITSSASRAKVPSRLRYDRGGTQESREWDAAPHRRATRCVQPSETPSRSGFRVRSISVTSRGKSFPTISSINSRSHPPIRLTSIVWMMAARKVFLPRPYVHTKQAFLPCP